jgi:hypothetical protein
MRNLLLAVGIVLLMAGCGEGNNYSVSITNNSTDKAVSYTYDGHSDTLSVSETKFYEVKAYTEPPKKIVDQNGIASMKMNQKGDSFTFIPADPLNLKVKNQLPYDVTIKADNYIDNSGSMELTINSDDENTDAKIYTKNPRFTFTFDQPTIYSYPIIYELAIVGEEMSVIIR